MFISLNRNLVNLWRAEIAVPALRTWAMKLERSGKRYLAVEQVRRKFHNVSIIDDYAQKFAKYYLYELHTSNYTYAQIEVIPLAIDEKIISRNNREFLMVIEDYKTLGMWPRQK